ncbi:hypothetical protein EOL73_04205 [Candidatus Saccharibacteria bacterium]|nr:hypothetical protein [Candidatus Saccharibacteria bacterium]NCU40929.1 hypothetical protein [Candidatus Saccharibacteria bacterium]
MTYDELVWKIGIQLPESIQRDACEYVLDKLEYVDGLPRESDIPKGKMQEARQRVKYFFQRFLVHKQYENSQFPSDTTASLIKVLETTIDGMQKIKG